MEGWDSSYFYDEASVVSSVVDPLDLISRQPPQSFLAQSFRCKQEIEAENLRHHMNPEQFIQLPQLESPSVPLMKRPSTVVSLVSDNNNEDHDDQNRLLLSNKKVTDWRDLDKFVASQLSQETEGLPSFENHGGSDMALFEGTKLSPFLSTSSDCDIGICVFEK